MPGPWREWPLLPRVGARPDARLSGPQETAMSESLTEARTGVPPAEAAPAEGTATVSLRVNGAPVRARLDTRTSLLDFLREHLHLTGTKRGCDLGQCGACTVHLDGRRVNACLTLAVACEDAEITTIEGLGSPQSLHPMQAAFVEHDALQC